MHRYKKYVPKVAAIAIFTLAACLCAIFFVQFLSGKESLKTYVLSEPHTSNHIVTLTDTGFEPADMVIRQNESVTFNTIRGTAFWPASNIHPQHTIYPAFDPKRPIEADATWEFVFDTPGVWAFHDHISANDTGTVTVLDQNGTVMSPSKNFDINECAQFSDYTQKQQCWDQQLNGVMKKEGLEAAFDFFSALYKTEPDVPKECHGWGHVLGKAGYEVYKEKGLALRPETSFCGYGFYHGFLAELMKDTGDITKAREFCENAVTELEGGLNNIRRNCIHGIGHGAASMLLEDPQNWGKFQKVVDTAVVVCEGLYTEDEDVKECYDGVFNDIYLDIFQNKNGFTYEAYMAKGDPFIDCQLQEERYKESCYFEVSGSFWRIFNYDVVAATKYALANVQDLEQRGQKVIARIAADRIQNSITNQSHADSMEACHLVPNFLYKACFEGILNGFMQHGEPGNLDAKGYAFCEEESLNALERNECYEQFTQMLRGTYTETHMEQVCSVVTQKREVAACADF